MINKKLSRVLTLITLLIVLVGCDPIELVMKPLPEKSDHLARVLLQTLAKGDVDGAVNLMDPKLEMNGEVRAKFDEIAVLMSADELKEISLVRYSNLKALIQENQRRQFTYELIFKGSWAVANIAVDFMDGERYVIGVYVEPLERSLSETNAFTFENKSMVHYMMIALAVIIPLFSLFAIYICVQKKEGFAMWIWAVFILLGIGNVSINWTSGSVAYNIISITSVWAPGLRDGPSGAYYITYAIPVGAIVFLYVTYMKKK
ncbi:MAG: hypothetical protein V3V95_03010 [Thermodesulfobacteriota bacterium]